MANKRTVSVDIMPMLKPFVGSNIREANKMARDIAAQIQKPLQQIGIKFDPNSIKGVKTLSTLLKDIGVSIQQTNNGFNFLARSASGLSKNFSLGVENGEIGKAVNISTSNKNLTPVKNLQLAYQNVYKAQSEVYKLEEKGIVKGEAYDRAKETLRQYNTELQNTINKLKQRFKLQTEIDSTLKKKVFTGNGEIAKTQRKNEYLLQGQTDTHNINIQNQADIQRRKQETQAIRQYVAAAKEELVQRQHLAQLEKTKGTTPEAIKGQKQIVDIAHQNTEALKQQAQNAEGFAEAQKQVDYATQKTNQKILEQNKTVEKSNGIFGNFKNTLKQVVQAGLSWKIFSAITRSLNDSIQTVIELDKSIVDLQIVMNSSREEAEKYLQTYNKMAQELGSTTQEVADSAVEWQRQGYSVNETNTLIKNSMILSKVGMLESAEATEYLTSAMKGYQLSVQDSMGVIDQLTAIDLEAAVSAGGLAEAMARTANSARIAGVEMEQLLGYLAVTGEVTQKSMSQIGESKIIDALKVA